MTDSSRGTTGPASFPHCDQRILHAPGECEYCDLHADWQELRSSWGVAFTGHTPGDREVPCPADALRPPGSASDHRRWGGNKPTSADGTWPQELPASVMIYGEPAAQRDWQKRFLAAFLGKDR